MATFRDTNTGFTINRLPDLVSEEDSIIYSSLINLFGCIIGQRARIGQPLYGSRLRQFLQEPVTQTTASAIETDLLESIRRWEPRIRMSLQETFVTMTPSLPGYRIRLAFYMIAGNTQDLNVVEFDVQSNGTF